MGPSRDAILQVDCALGKAPEEHTTDGIRLTLEGGGEFDLEPSGRTMFVFSRLGENPPPKPTATGDQISPALPQVQR